MSRHQNSKQKPAVTQGEFIVYVIYLIATCLTILHTICSNFVIFILCNCEFHRPFY